MLVDICNQQPAAKLLLYTGIKRLIYQKTDRSIFLKHSLIIIQRLLLQGFTSAVHDGLLMHLSLSVSPGKGTQIQILIFLLEAELVNLDCSSINRPASIALIDSESLSSSVVSICNADCRVRLTVEKSSIPLSTS